jgi:hypothetical protein
VHRSNALRLAVLLALLLFAAAPAALAKEPPNPHDRCSSAGRDTCGTTGVGFYRTYRYGLRWFGDYRGAVADAIHTFCIDLQYWYPSPSYRYEAQPTDSLRNRDGEAVALEHRRLMAYAMWAWGRTDNANRQAAVMLYVHSLMGDARPGEADPRAVGDAVAAIYAQVAKDAARYHGPYRVTVDAPTRLRVGEQGAATIRVLAATGEALPDVELALTAQGATVPARVSTGADGVAHVQFTARTAGGVTIDAKTEPIASTLPAVYAPTTPAAAVNGQRLAAPTSQVVTGTSQTAAFQAQAHVSSVADPATVTLGGATRDRVTLAGVGEGYDAVVTARLFGPFRSTGAIRCDGQPASESTWRPHGPGEYTTEAVRPAQPGWYVFRQIVPDTAAYLGAQTNCTDPAERVKVVAQPSVHTQVSAQHVAQGAAITDTVVVKGLGGEQATVSAALYGPFPARDAIDCGGSPVWTGTVAANGDGDYRTDPFTPATPGFYVYRETLAPSEFVRAAASTCVDEAETTVVAAAPEVHTQVSDTTVRPGAELTDKVTLSGAGPLELAIDVELFGPFATRGGVSCSGTPVWKGVVAARGNGTYRTEPATVDRVGYYTYRESIAAAPQTPAFAGQCGETSETSLVTAVPRVTTRVSDEVVVPGAAVSDEVVVAGLGSTEARIGVELFGPFATRAAIACTGAPYDRAELFAHGDGTFRTPAVHVSKAGFYVFREHLAGTDLIAETTTDCAAVAETTLSRPEIITGRNDVTAGRRVAAPDPLTPTRVRVESLGIDAPVFPSAIDLKQGVLDVPPQISRLGWWVDGTTPGSSSGALLVAGHVDSAAAGAGALFNLKDAKRGALVRVTTRSGRTFAYRVVSVQTMLKKDLPTSIFSAGGRPRLVLVTCGGPFDPSIRHYRDNVVVTAVPA